MYVGYEQVAATSTVKTVDDLTVPGDCVGVELQAETNDVRYTMDGEAATPTATAGMLLIAGGEPKFFDAGALANIRFRNDGTDGVLNIHYMGRSI